jgi:uncharacterized protein
MSGQRVKFPHGPLTLAGCFDLPKAEGRVPLVILLHGFTGWKEEEHLAGLAQSLAKAGIAALRYDAPGSGESSGTFADDYRLSNYLDSVESAINFVSALNFVDTDRMAIWGHSMGGYVAMASAIRYAGKFQAVCGSQPSSGKGSVPTEQEEQWKRTGWASFANLHFRRLDLPYEFYQDRKDHDIFAVIDKLAVPLLLIGGTRDELVPAVDVQKIYAAAPEPKTYEEFNVNHFYKKAPGPLAHINKSTTDFFAQVLL